MRPRLLPIFAGSVDITHKATAFKHNRKDDQEFWIL